MKNLLADSWSLIRDFVRAHDGMVRIQDNNSWGYIRIEWENGDSYANYFDGTYYLNGKRFSLA